MLKLGKIINLKNFRFRVPIVKNYRRYGCCHYKYSKIVSNVKNSRLKPHYE